LECAGGGGGEGEVGERGEERVVWVGGLGDGLSWCGVLTDGMCDLGCAGLFFAYGRDEERA